MQSDAKVHRLTGLYLIDVPHNPTKSWNQRDSTVLKRSGS